MYFFDFDQLFSPNPMHKEFQQHISISYTLTETEIGANGLGPLYVFNWLINWLE